ncbi:MAG TPA: acetate/propionate family kinase [Bryobacteraceae bacterium]|nr:acetate/propionate family kinase [Bryobacteraceae bacterium]
MRILVINGGSSSFKCRLDDLPEGPLPTAPPKPEWEKHVEWDQSSGVADVLEPVLKSIPGSVDVVGHRIVHGGPVYRQTTALTPEVRAAIAKEIEFAPAHNRFELEAVQAVDRFLGSGVLQIAVFDTGFHATLTPDAYVYPGPYAWLEQGIRRYGFHGINHQYASRRAAEVLGADPASLKLIVCHLGNGASLTAVRGGKSADTTMGFTPLEGLMMGSRCGSIDPGILVYLIRHRGSTAEQLDEIMNQKSGLLGVSGISGDMRKIESAMEAGNGRAQLAFDMYVHRLLRELGAMLAVLGGVDAIIFTGGVGENSARLRERVCSNFGFLGLKLDATKNALPPADQDIAASDSRVRVLVIRAQEEWEIARECHQLTHAA